MADTKISALPSASTLAGTEVLPLVQGGATKGATANQLKTFAQTGLLKSNVATTNPGGSDDGTQGYAVGSTWINSSTMQRWVCANSSTGAAVWDAMDYADHLGYVAGNWYAPQNAALSNGTAPGTTTVYFFPFVCKQRLTVDQLAARVTTVSAGGNFQMAIYRADAATKNPTGTALATTASLSTASQTTLNAALSASVQLEPGALYHFGIMVDNGTAAFAGPQGSNTYGSWLMGTTTVVNTTGSSGQIQGRRCALGAYGTWPDVTSATWVDITAGFVNISFRVASVP